jgi:hypothetical protein
MPGSHHCRELGTGDPEALRWTGHALVDAIAGHLTSLQTER